MDNDLSPTRRVFCIHACYYGCSHLLIYFGFLYVSIDVCGYFTCKAPRALFGFVRFINIHFYYCYYFFFFATQDGRTNG